MNTQDREQLKPCPFCGGDQIHEGYIRDGYKVYCSTCDGSVLAYMPECKKKATRKWNTRAALPSGQPEGGREELRKGDYCICLFGNSGNKFWPELVNILKISEVIEHSDKPNELRFENAHPEEKFWANDFVKVEYGELLQRIVASATRKEAEQGEVEEKERAALVSLMEIFVYGSEIPRPDKDEMTERIWKHFAKPASAQIAALHAEINDLKEQVKEKEGELRNWKEIASDWKKAAHEALPRIRELEQQLKEQHPTPPAQGDWQKEEDIEVLANEYCDYHYSEGEMRKFYSIAYAAYMACGRKFIAGRTATAQGWVSVEDRLPEESGMFLCYADITSCIPEREYWCVAFDAKSGKFIYGHKQITHWQPLPPPPANNNQNDKKERE